MIPILTDRPHDPFGMLTPGRNWCAGSEYRYGFNGKEQDPETYGEGNIYDYGFRIYNPRLGKFLSVDPLSKSYPWYTPFQFAGNKPISCIDLDGAEELLVIRYFDDAGMYVGSTLLRVQNIEQRDAGHRNGGDMQIIELNQRLQPTIEDVYTVTGNDITNLEPILKQNGVFIGKYYEKMQPQYEKTNKSIIEENNTNAVDEIDNLPRPVKFRTTLVNFVFDSDAEVPTVKKSEIESIKNAMSNDPERMINITGYASLEGAHTYNLELSLQRANKVKDFLIENGIAEDRILTVSGAGGTDKYGAGVENYEKNRVAEISFTYEMSGE